MPDTIKHQIPCITRAGRIAFGNLLKQHRGSQSLDEIIDSIRSKTNLCIVKSTLSHLERGNVEPTINTLFLLSTTILSDYSVWDMIKILAEIQ